jgi:hypothetical protein
LHARLVQLYHTTPSINTPLTATLLHLLLSQGFQVVSRTLNNRQGSTDQLFSFTYQKLASLAYEHQEEQTYITARETQFQTEAGCSGVTGHAQWTKKHEQHKTTGHMGSKAWQCSGTGDIHVTVGARQCVTLQCLMHQGNVVGWQTCSSTSTR